MPTKERAERERAEDNPLGRVRAAGRTAAALRKNGKKGAATSRKPPVVEYADYSVSVTLRETRLPGRDPSTPAEITNAVNDYLSLFPFVRLVGIRVTRVK